MADAAGAAIARRVRRVWSRADSIGVEFLEPAHALPVGAVQAAPALRI